MPGMKTIGTIYNASETNSINLNKIAKAYSKLEQEFEREPSPEELAKVLDLPTEKI